MDHLNVQESVADIHVIIFSCESQSMGECVTHIKADESATPAAQLMMFNSWPKLLIWLL